MKRAFFSLYIVVVIGIMAIGWGIDRFYQSVNETSATDVIDSAFFQLLENQLLKNKILESTLLGDSLLENKSTRTQVIKTQLTEVIANTGLDAELYTLAGLADSSLKERILDGEIVLLSMSKGARQLYHRIGDTEFIVKLHVPAVKESNRYLSDLLLVVFYLGIAAIIYIWVWPLMRDLRALENQVGAVGKGSDYTVIEVGNHSNVRHLAGEFNRMQQRINNLLATYKEMTNAVSHELRTPLARMKFALALAETTDDPSKRDKQLASLRTDINDMESLVAQLLNYAGFEAQSETLQFETGDLSALVKQLFSEQQEALIIQNKTAISFTLINEIAGQPVFCEWHLMQRVLHNLLSNAARFTVTKIEVTLSICNDQYTIQIEDDGPGIAIADRERVFNSFVRLQTTQAPKVKGFGLGLAIVKRIMGWHSGSVSLIDGSLEGACFVLSWPCLGKGG